MITMPADVKLKGFVVKNMLGKPFEIVDLFSRLFGVFMLYRDAV